MTQRDIRIDAIQSLMALMERQDNGAHMMINKEIAYTNPMGLFSAPGAPVPVATWQNRSTAVVDKLLIEKATEGLTVTIAGIALPNATERACEEALRALVTIEDLYPEVLDNQDAIESFTIARDGKWNPGQGAVILPAPSAEIALLKYIASQDPEFSQDPVDAWQRFDVRGLQIAKTADLSKVDAESFHGWLDVELAGRWANIDFAVRPQVRDETPDMS